MKWIKLLLGSYTFRIGILFHLAAIGIGLMLFQYPQGTYLNLMSERLLIAGVIQLWFFAGPFIALWEGRGLEKLGLSLAALAMIFTIIGAYQITENIVFDIMDLST